MCAVSWAVRMTIMLVLWHPKGAGGNMTASVITQREKLFNGKTPMVN